jgi:cell division transport system permease protein
MSLASWLTRHAQTAIGGLGTLARNPGASALTIAVIGIALAMPAALNLLVQQGRLLAGDVEASRDFSVYLAPGVDVERAVALRETVQGRPGVAAVRLVTADDAAVELREEPGFADALATLGANPLPHTLVVRPAADATPAAVAALAAELRREPGVDLVRVDTGWIERLMAILDLVRRIVLVAGALLGLTVLFVVGNTIRLDIQNRAQEIEVAKLLGATDGFVRRPFLYLGFWYGLAGALLALVLLGLTLAAIAGPVTRLLALYGAAGRLGGPGLDTVAGVLLGGILAGWGGAWLAVGRHLSAIQPKL